MKLFSGLKQRVQRLRRQNERGSILILVVLSALIIIGSAGLAVDVGRLYATKAELSRAVDAAALAGVLEFDGTAQGLTNASLKSQTYMLANEPTLTPYTTPCSVPANVKSWVCIGPDGANSTLRINATKSTRLYFLPIFGINSAPVSAKAISGFNDQTLDAVMVIDSTYSMNGTPIVNARNAATNFKNVLLGTSPSGNVYVGVSPLRGCYRPTPSTYSDCVYNTVQGGSPPPAYVKDLTSNSSALDAAISSVTPGGASATNVCTGLGKGFEVLTGASGYAAPHSSSNNRRFLVLLSDGDNVYFGQNVYVAGPPKSPNTFNIGGTNYDCQPPNNCSGWGTPCSLGTYPGSSVTVATDSISSSALNGGTGWAGNWTVTNGSPVLTNLGTPTQSGTYHLRLSATDTIYRAVDLTGVTSASLTYYHKQLSLESGDNALVQCSTSTSGPWTTLRDWNTTASSYASDTVTLPSACRNAMVYIRFAGSMGDTSDQVYFDTISVTNTAVNRDGYLNGQDGQNYTSCTETPAPRERQVDALTLNIANAIKAQNVEIFVVAFSACPDGDGANVYNNPGNQTCQSLPNPLTSAPASGRVGDTMVETNANARLAKCIASSTPGTNDHYWYSSDAATLPNIFTTIAAQIAHRLVE